MKDKAQIQPANIEKEKKKKIFIKKNTRNENIRKSMKMTSKATNQAIKQRC